MVNLVLKRTGTPAYTWLLVLLYVIYILKGTAMKIDQDEGLNAQDWVTTADIGELMGELMYKNHSETAVF